LGQLINTIMKILAIDTSCDETAVAITDNRQIVSCAIWSQSNLHSSFGGVMPSLAKRQHQERIDWVVDKALGKKHKNLKGIDAIAVTVGKGLAVALEVGILKAKELASKHKLPLIPVNHVEAHLLSPFAKPNTSTENATEIKFPALGLILSGGTTEVIKIESIGSYQVLAKTVDDALGEALDKGARLLGLGYPGGSVLEKIARNGDTKRFKLPVPLQQDVIKNRFSYSGLKTAFVRLYETIEKPNRKDVSDLASSFQEVAFEHVLNVLEYQIKNSGENVKDLLFGGGVVNNILIRKKLRKLCKKYNLKLHIPYDKKLMGDNAAMVGVCAYLKYKDSDLNGFYNHDSVDRQPKLDI
jgi:N6-L-threonylcarbamoyladenine synthase